MNVQEQLSALNAEAQGHLAAATEALQRGDYDEARYAAGDAQSAIDKCWCLIPARNKEAKHALRKEDASDQ